MVEMNKKNKEEREKLRAIILTVEKTTQKLVCETEQLKMDNMYFQSYFREYKKKMLINEQKVNSLEILLKDLYTKFETLKEEK